MVIFYSNFIFLWFLIVLSNVVGLEREIKRTNFTEMKSFSVPSLAKRYPVINNAKLDLWDVSKLALMNVIYNVRGLSSSSGSNYMDQKRFTKRTLVPGGSYYEFFVNEASYKFWVVFQLTTVLILLYSAFAAIYFAKYTFLTEVENIKEEDLLRRNSGRSSFVGLDPATYQRILDTTHPTTT